MASTKFQAITSLAGYSGTHYINLNSKEIPYAVKFHEVNGFLNDAVIDSIHLSRRNGFLSKPYRNGDYNGGEARPGYLSRGRIPTPDQSEWLARQRKHILNLGVGPSTHDIRPIHEWWESVYNADGIRLWFEDPTLPTMGVRNMKGGGSGWMTIQDVLGTDLVTVDGTIANRPEPTPEPTPAPAPAPAPLVNRTPRSWQEPSDTFRCDMSLQEVIQEMRRRADMSDDGVIISTRTVKGIIQWLDRGMPLSAALDRITQSWTPETIAHICGHIPGVDWLVNQRRNKQPLTFMGDWQRVIDEAEDRGMTPASWWPHVIDILTLPTQRAWLFGPTGCGKTYGFSQMCEVMGWNTVHVGCGNDMILSDLVGGINPKTATGWQDGPVLDAYENGKTLILDEFAKLSADCTGGLNSYLNGEPMVSVPRPGNTVAHKHPDFRVVVCDNSAGNGTDGQYMVEQQSVDTVARFEHLGLQVFCNYDNNIEAAIIGDWND